MIRFPMFFGSPGEAGGGDAGAGADAGGDVGPDGGGEVKTWHAEHKFFQDNPDAVKSFADFKSPDDVFKSYGELRKQQSQPFRLPKDVGKLSAEQQTEFHTALAKLNGVPESPEGYKFEIPEDVPLHEPTMEKLRVLLHKLGINDEGANEILGLQVGMTRDLATLRKQQFEGLSHNTFKIFKNRDCNGDAALVATHMVNIKNYLQKQAVDENGKPNPKEWEAFCDRHFLKMADGTERMPELILLRALARPAMETVGEGGAPVGSLSYHYRGADGKEPYAEMRGK